jgi:hypothetical protein
MHTKFQRNESMFAKSEMKVNATEKPWNTIILVNYVKKLYEKPWKITNVQAKNPQFRVKPSAVPNPEQIQMCIVFINFSFLGGHFEFQPLQLVDQEKVYWCDGCGATMTKP